MPGAGDGGIESANAESVASMCNVGGFHLEERSGPPLCFSGDVALKR
jgi:hypothetical protein